MFKFAKNLKGQENQCKQAYFIRSELDPEQVETRNIYRMLRKENYALEENQRLAIRMHKNRIMVNNEPLITKVSMPSHADILCMRPDEIETARAVRLILGGDHNEKNSEFYAYIHKVCAVQDVQKGLLKLKLKHGDATHISCAYHLEGAQGPYLQEGLDDNEFGAGRTILKVLKEK